jgi:hypothetical protein
MLSLRLFSYIKRARNRRVNIKMSDLRINPIGLGSSAMYISQTVKSQKVLSSERANRDKRKRMERFLEREGNIKRSLPDWLGQYVNMLV